MADFRALLEGRRKKVDERAQVWTDAGKKWQPGGGGADFAYNRKVSYVQRLLEATEDTAPTKSLMQVHVDAINENDDMPTQSTTHVPLPSRLAGLGGSAASAHQSQGAAGASLVGSDAAAEQQLVEETQEMAANDANLDTNLYEAFAAEDPSQSQAKEGGEEQQAYAEGGEAPAAEGEASAYSGPPLQVGDWQACWDDAYQAYYYWNAASNETTWETPQEMVDAGWPAPAAAAATEESAVQEAPAEEPPQLEEEAPLQAAAAPAAAAAHHAVAESAVHASQVAEAVPQQPPTVAEPPAPQPVADPAASAGGAAAVSFEKRMSVAAPLAKSGGASPHPHQPMAAPPGIQQRKSIVAGAPPPPGAAPGAAAAATAAAARAAEEEAKQKLKAHLKALYLKTVEQYTAGVDLIKVASNGKKYIRKVRLMGRFLVISSKSVPKSIHITKIEDVKTGCESEDFEKLRKSTKQKDKWPSEELGAVVCIKEKPISLLFATLEARDAFVFMVRVLRRQMMALKEQFVEANNDQGGGGDSD